MTNTAPTEFPQILVGKRALVTGGSRGIGAAIAQTLAAAGADLAIVGRQHAGLLQTQSEIESLGRECLLIEADLATVEGARQVGEIALAHAPYWDILVNNAGVAKTAPLLEITPEDWDFTHAVNLRSVLLVSQQMVPPMIARRSGRIINISSMGAFIGTPTVGNYAASKGGLNQLTRTMAVEWGVYNIQTNAVCPTVIMTDMGQQIWDDPAVAELRKAKEARIPMHRFGEVQEVADLVLFLCGPGANYLNGLSIPLDGGMLVAP